MILLGEENHPEYNTKGVDGHIFLVKILSVHLGSGVVYVYHLNLAQNAFQCYQTTQSFTIKRHEKESHFVSDCTKLESGFLSKHLTDVLVAEWKQIPAVGLKCCGRSSRKIWRFGSTVEQTKIEQNIEYVLRFF